MIHDRMAEPTAAPATAAAPGAPPNADEPVIDRAAIDPIVIAAM
jgi:hypothetical protein